ncbi:flowering time control protein FCA-like isoform X2 [Carex rostrata]
MDRNRGERSGDRNRTQSRWSSGSPTQGGNHRHSRGGGEGFSGGGGRYHPYRGGNDYEGGFRGGSGGGGGPGGGFNGPPMSGGPMPAPRRGGFSSSRGDSPDREGRISYVKLFIGSVPPTATEEDIRPLFEEHGNVIEVAFIKDKKTGEQRGCCFVKYTTHEEAERAIRALHNQYTLPGEHGPVQVRYADGERERHGQFQGAAENKLFVASMNKQATPQEIHEIFAPYGHVEDVYIMRDAMKQSRGCGFVKFASRDQATAAMNDLNGNFVMRGCDQPLIVRFADPKRPRPGESRGGPAFGGPGFSPRSDTALVIRPTANLDEPRDRRGPHEPWRPPSPQALGGNQFNNYGPDNHAAGRGGPVTSSTDSANMFTPPMFPSNGSLPNHSAAPSSAQSGGNLSMPQIRPGMAVPQMSPMQKPLVSSQQNFPTMPQPNPQQMQGPLSQPPIQQMSGPHQVPQSSGLNSFGQSASSLQIPGLGNQMPNQPFMQQNAPPSGAPLQPPLGMQQQFPQLQHQQQVPQLMLQQQQQALQSSFQSSQQAIMQLQQQLQMMQQQATQGGKQQAMTGTSTPAGSQASVMSGPPLPATAPSLPLTCNWTEHTSPEGFKYYYNNITKESKWEKPEEFVLYEQQKLILLQQQQQKLAMQQLQPPSQPQVQQGPPQMQMKQQQLMQPPLQFQAGQQGLQDMNFAQFQAAGPAVDPNRIQQRFGVIGILQKIF